MTGCADVVEHGNAVVLNIKTTDCDGGTVVDGATQLRFTATSAEGPFPTRTTAISSIPRTFGLVNRRTVSTSPALMAL